MARGKDKGGRTMGGPKKLAPLDHIKILYDGAAANLKGENRKIFQKKDLVDAVREMNSGTGLNKLLSSQSDTALALVSKEAPAGKEKAPGQEPKRRRLPAVTLARGRDARRIKSPEEILQNALNFNSRKYNELKVAVEQREEQLNTMIDELASLQVENDSLRRMELHETTDTHKIDDLRKAIEEAQEELERRQFRRSTLLHMKKRLDLNQVAFDAHIKGMEEALNASSREFEEVKLLMRQLETGNAVAQEALRTTTEKINKERDLRNKQLSLRRQEAANAKRMEEWREQREKARMVMDAELSGDLSEEGERQLIDAVKQSTAQDEELERIHQRTTQAVSTYEEAFAAIREATGVRTLDEMVEKFLGQSANKQALVEEKVEAEQRQRKVKEDLACVQTEFAEFKAAGIGGSELNREMYDKLDNDILEARHELKIKQAVNARLENILIQVRAGMLGLLSRLSPFKQVLNFEDDHANAKSGVEVLDLTLSCESKLMKLLDTVNAQHSRGGSAELSENSYGSAAAPGSAPGAGSAAGVGAAAAGGPEGAGAAVGPAGSGAPPSAAGPNAGPSDTLVVRSKTPGLDLGGSEEGTHVNNIRVRPRRFIGNGELGTPISTARSGSDAGHSDEDDGDDADSRGREMGLLTNGDDGQGEGSENGSNPRDSGGEHDDDDNDDNDDDDDDDDDESVVLDAAAMKKRAKARVNKAMEDHKAQARRTRTLTQLKDKKNNKERQKRLAQPARHRSRKSQTKGTFERPELV